MYNSDDIQRLFYNWDPEFCASAYSIFSEINFYANLCQVCLKHNRESPLKLCSGCKMISYCCKEHQIQHWKKHKKFCRIISAQLKLRQTTNIFDSICLADGNELEFIPLKDKKICILQFMRDTLPRKLYQFEIGMILFTKSCETCGITNPSLLYSCPNCPHANFCKDHKEDPEHEKLCHLYTLCCLLDSVQVLYPNNKEAKCFKVASFDGSREHFSTSMEDFMNSYCSSTIFKDFNASLLFKFYSEYLTSSMTLTYVLKNLNLPQNSEMEIHIVGQELEDVYENHYWEIILYWLPYVKNLKIMFFIPGITATDLIPSVLEICFQDGKKLNLQYCDLSYEKYVKSDQFVQPTIVAGFNFENDLETISILKELNCPFIITALSVTEFYENLEMISQCFEVNDLCLEKNLFASLKYLRVTELKGISCSNMFLIYKKVEESSVKKNQEIESIVEEQSVLQSTEEYEKLVEENTSLKNEVKSFAEKKKMFQISLEKFAEDCLKDIEKIDTGLKKIRDMLQENYKPFSTKKEDREEVKNNSL